MTNDQTTQLQRLLDCPPGQWDDAARREFLDHAHRRLTLLAAKIFRESFPRLKNLHDTASIVNEASVRLLQALETVQPGTVRAFFALAAQRIRWILLDLARKAGQVPPAAPLTGDEAALASPSSSDPAKLAMWTEFHERMADLPETDREVVHCLWYLGLNQAETAKLLGIHPKQVSRLWLTVRLKLADWLPE
jgi:RNA polymerase sigma factor (sigma-70 family)